MASVLRPRGEVLRELRRGTADPERGEVADAMNWLLRHEPEALIAAVDASGAAVLRAWLQQLLPEELAHWWGCQRAQQLRTTALDLGALLPELDAAGEAGKVDAGKLSFWLDLLAPAQAEAVWGALPEGGEGRAKMGEALGLCRHHTQRRVEWGREQGPSSPSSSSSSPPPRSASSPAELKALGDVPLAELQARLGLDGRAITQRDFAVPQDRLLGVSDYGPNLSFAPEDVRRIEASGAVLEDVITNLWQFTPKYPLNDLRVGLGLTQKHMMDTQAGFVERAPRDFWQTTDFNQLKVAAQKSRRLLLQMKRGGVDALDSSQQEPEPDMSLLETKADLSREAHDHFVAIHPEVMDTYKARDPRWGRLERMPFVDFLIGLRERNWTSPSFDPKAEPWTVHVYKGGGAAWPLNSWGMRAHVRTAAGKEFKVLMPRPGPSTHTDDYLAKGSPGGVWNNPRLPERPQTVGECGSNQALLEIALAYEQYLPREGREQVAATGGMLEPGKLRGADGSPSEGLLNVQFLPAESVPSPHLAFLGNKWLVFGAALSVFVLGRVVNTIFFENQDNSKLEKLMNAEEITDFTEFAKSSAAARQEGKTGVALKDVAGIDYLRDELLEVVELLKFPDKFKSLGVLPPKGVLMCGPPGVGKTLVAKAIAGEAGVPFLAVPASEFTELLVGVGASRVRDIFKRARANAPCVIFFDEIEVLGFKRQRDSSANQDEERDQALNQLLTEMDGFTPGSGVLVVGATNAINFMDDALLRPGRFDRKIQLQKPNTDAREEILQVITQKHPCHGDVDLRQIARDTRGMTGAELERLMNEAALEAVRQGQKEVRMDMVYFSLDKLEHGGSRSPLPKDYETNEVLAAHEAGKALVAEVLHKELVGVPIAEVERISIVPRVRSKSRTIFLSRQDEAHRVSTQAELEARIQVLLAGRASQEFLLGAPTTYEINDVSKAMDAALVMANNGLTPRGVYPCTFKKNLFYDDSKEIQEENPQIRLEDETALDLTAGLMPSWSPDGHLFAAPSEAAQLEMEGDVLGIVRGCYKKNLELFGRHEGALRELVTRLVEERQLLGPEVHGIVEGKGTGNPQPAR